LRTILTDTQRLGRLVEQLLDLARLEASAETQGEVADLAAIGRQQVAAWQERAAHRQITLTVENSKPVFVAVREAHLETLLDNLLKNALKYTPPGGWVKVEIKQERMYASLVVSDSGIGFEPDVAERLFDRFYRAETSEVQAQSGNGLGLAIVQAIVRAYGGKLTATSAGLGEGSRFTVQLPRREEA
jgi:two-component system OmpR family sensor kinase